ncbi:hypothetical protein DV735_g3431, partial [Chaetothyriales sp. CBS 134920]
MSTSAGISDTASEVSIPPKEKWTLGILNDKYTDEVPGTVLLLAADRNEPLGLHHQPGSIGRRDSSMPPQLPIPPRPRRQRSSSASAAPVKKRTPDGKIILDPQPDDSPNDPLNWNSWRRDTALICLGFYCMLGGGMTPVVAAGFSDIAKTFDVSMAQVARTTGLFMMGLGVGGVLASPTAILFGKRPVYLVSSILFAAFSLWCGFAPNYANLVAARVFQGISVSPVEVLPSASIAEIFYLHERAFRLGIYTLLLLSGKNLIPLVSAAIIQSLGWRWVFYIVAMVVGFAGALLFFFVPETFWDRTPRPKARRPSILVRRLSDLLRRPSQAVPDRGIPVSAPQERATTEAPDFGNFRFDREEKDAEAAPADQSSNARPGLHVAFSTDVISRYNEHETDRRDFVGDSKGTPPEASASPDDPEPPPPVHPNGPPAPAPAAGPDENPSQGTVPIQPYTTTLLASPPKTYLETLKPWNGRLSQVNWLKVAARPFILITYPGVLWSSLVYSLSIGWLIVLSESVTYIFGHRSSYHFSALGVGLVYLSPFVGALIGTLVAGKLSDLIVKWMARRNGGVYEPEFRLIMGLPVAISTVIGLMGFGWSAQERDNFMVPTVFFGIISFGCSLGSTTAITFCVDSYRQYAGEALVTLNFCKNIFHGLVFSLFFSSWLESDGPRTTFLAVGGIQLACLTTTVPMYIFGKRARMETARRGWMDKF